MDKPQVTNLVAQFVPADARVWVMAALRHDPVVWLEAQNTDLIDRLRQNLAQNEHFQPDQWSPGALALLQMDLPLSAQALHAPESLALARDQHKTAHQALETLASQASAPNLAQAGWAALSWRIRFDQKKSWQPLLDDISANLQANWTTPLACLLHFAPQPSHLVETLLTPGASVLLHAFALHMLLSNPLMPEQIVDLLLQNPQAPEGKNLALSPAEQLRILRWLSTQRPPLARRYSQRRLEADGAKMQAIVSQAANTAFTPSTLEQHLLLAELYSLQEQPEQSLALLSAARAGLCSSLSDLHAQSAHIGSTLPNADAALLAEIEQNWTSAAQGICKNLATPRGTIYQPELILHLLEQGKAEDAQALIPSPTDLPNAGAPMQIAAAQHAFQTGRPELATQYALQALKAWQYSDTPRTQPDLAWDVVLRTYRRLPVLLEGLGHHIEAAQAIHLLLSQSPADAGLLSQLSATLTQTGQAAAALDAIQIANLLSPDDQSIQEQLIACLEQVGHWSEALEQRQARIQALPTQDCQPPIDEWLALAHCALQAGQPDSALPACKEALRLAPEDGRAHLYQGQAMFQLGNIEPALEHLVQATLQSPELPQAWLSLAEAQTKNQQNQLALETLRTAAQALPESPQVFLALGSRHLAENNPTQAITALQQAASLDPADPEIALLLGKTLAQLGYQEDASQVLGAAYYQKPLYPDLAHTYAQILLAQHAYAQAIAPLETAIHASPDTHQQEILIALGSTILAAWEQGDPSADLDRAINALQQALSILPAPHEAQGVLADVFLANHEHIQALKVYQSLMDTPLAQHPEWASRLPFGLGRAALALGQHETAIAALQEAAQANPINPAIYRSLSEAQLCARLDADSYQSACLAIEVAPEDTNTLLWFANHIDRLYPDSIKNAALTPLDILTSARVKALQALEQAAQISPQRADVHLRLAEWQLQMGNQALAIQSYKNVFDADTNTSADLQKAGAALLQFGETRTAIDCLERSVELERHTQSRLSPGLLASLSRAYRQAGNIELALEHLEQALLLDTSNPGLYLEKACMLRELRQDENALECLDQGIDNTPSDHKQASLHRIAAQIHRSRGNLPDALLHARQGLRLCQVSPLQEQSPEAFTLVHLSLLNLTADLHRALLQPEQALHLLNHDAPPGVHSLSPSLPEALEYTCLRAELTLEAGDPSDLQPILPPGIDPADQPRLFALQLRLAARSVNAGSATSEELLQRIDAHLSRTIRQPSVQPPLSHCLALFEAAVDGLAWDTAHEIVDFARKQYASEPLAHLTLARWITLRAEFQRLCQANQVIVHAPGQDALSATSQDQLLDAMDTANRLLNDFHARSQIAKALKTVSPNPSEISSLETLPPNPILVRWQVRGQAAFSTRAQDIDQILATIYRRPGRAFQYAAEDAAALIAALSGLSQPAPTPAITKTILQAARPYPKNALVLTQVALALMPVNPGEALKTAQAAAKSAEAGPAAHTAIANALCARLAHLHADHSAAQAFIENALTIWPEEPRWQFLAADICAAIQDSRQAVAHLEHAVQQDPSHLAAHMALGRAYLSATPGSDRQALQAIPIFQRAAQLAPQSPEPLICLAKAQMRAEYLQEAAQNAEKAAALSGDAFEALLVLADIALHQDNPQQSYHYAQSAHELRPHDPDAATHLAHALHALQRTAEAIQVLEKTIPNTPDALVLRLLHAGLLREQGELDEAIKVYKEIVLQKAATPQVYALLAQTLAEKDDIPSAVRAAQRAIQISSKGMPAAEKGEMHALLGHFLRLSGQLDQAIHHLSTAVQLTPQSLDAHLELGLARKERREYAQALQIFQLATDLAPQDPRPHYQAGLALKESKDYREAEAMLRRAASLAPEDVNIRKQLAAVVALNLVHNPKPRGIQR